MTIDPISLFTLDPARLAEIKASTHLKDRLLPEQAIFAFRRPVTVRILIVSDSIGGFDDRAFGLAELIAVLAEAPGPWVRFVVTTAHRLDDGSAMLRNFRFDTSPLDYDQIWLFGVERLPGNLSNRELRMLAEFMDGGGGVFATGDHENLGETLCSQVPRVRSMRSWTWPNAGPGGEPPGPPVDGPSRHDTLVRRGGEDILFDHQSDDVPQEIFPVMTVRRSGLLRRVSFPHEVLCGPRGIIRHMPDHPHEGTCLVPTNLLHVLTFEGRSFAEYPAAPDGSRPMPVIVARSHHTSRRPSDTKGALQPADFGSISAYDGHRAGVGRVLTDSTWHHFFNINLTGDPSSPDPRSREGFRGSAAGLAVYEDIKAYFRNVATYLARPAQLQAMRVTALWWTRFDHRVAMDLRIGFIDRLEGTARLEEYLRVGALAHDALGRLASRCQILGWVFDFGRIPKLVRRFIPPNDPIEHFDDALPVGELIDLLEPAILGAALYGLSEAFGPPAERDRHAKLEQGEIERVIDRAADEAAGLVAAHLEEAGKVRLRFVEELRAGGRSAD